jgi:hypothetical protein
MGTPLILTVVPASLFASCFGSAATVDPDVSPLPKIEISEFGETVMRGDRLALLPMASGMSAGCTPGRGDASPSAWPVIQSKACNSIC